MQKCENAKNAKRKGKNPKLNMTFINKIVIYNISGLYYKHVKIINDNSSVFIKWSFKLIDDARSVIYDCHMFIVQATGCELSHNSLFSEILNNYKANLITSLKNTKLLCLQ